jgi:hypothetical protein
MGFLRFLLKNIDKLLAGLVEQQKKGSTPY